MVVVFAAHGGTITVASPAGAVFMIVVPLMQWQFPLGLGGALTRHRALTLPILSAIFAATVAMPLSWVRSTW